MIVEIWENGNKRIGIQRWREGYLVIPSVFDGNKHQITGTKNFKRLASAQRRVTKLIETAKEAGTPGEYVKIK